MTESERRLVAVARQWAPLLLVLLLGAVLFFAAIDHGLPRHTLGPDEQITWRRVQGQDAPGRYFIRKYNWPYLLIDLSEWVWREVRRVDRRLGLEHPDPFLVGRTTVALLSLLTLVWVYLAARRLFGRRTGLLAGAFLAMMPLFAYRARLWVPDAPMTMFYALALLAAALILARPTWSRFLLAGVAVGLAAATKYHGALACLSVMVAAFLAWDRLPRERRVLGAAGRLGAAGLVAIGVFLAVSPWVLTDTERFLEGFGWVAETYRNEPPTGFLGWHVISYVLRAFWAGGTEGVGAWVCLLALAGVASLIGRRSREGVLVWLPAILYLAVYGATLRFAAERLFLPLTLHIAIAAACGTVAGARAAESLARRRWPEIRLQRGIAVGALLVALPPVLGDVVAARHGDTRLEAKRWIDSTLPIGAVVRYEWDALRPSRRRFAVSYLPDVLYRRTPRELARSSDFVVLSSTTFEWVRGQGRRPGFDERVAFYGEIFEGSRYELLATFLPDPLTFGPEIRVYRTLPPRGPKLRSTAESLDLLKRVWQGEPLPAALGGFRLARWWHRLGGRAVLVEGGRYLLEARVRSPKKVVMALSVGGRTRHFRVEGEQALRWEVELPEGQAWWTVGFGKGARPRSRAVVESLRLTRVVEEETASAEVVAGGGGEVGEVPEPLRLDRESAVLLLKDPLDHQTG